MAYPVLIRVDASPAIGGGHLARCRVLAKALQDCGFSPSLVTAEKDVARLVEKELPCICIPAGAGSEDDIEQTLQLAGQLQALFIIPDGYHFNSGYHRRLAAQLPLVVIDDENNRGPLFASVVINHLPTAESLGYAVTAADAECLLGAEYTLLPAAGAHLAEVAGDADADRLLVCFGASDVGMLTLPVVENLAERMGEGAPVDVVCGALCSQAEQVEAVCRRAGFRYFFNCTQMQERMQGAKLAVAAAGTMLFELAYFGVPTVFAVAADNQMRSAEFHRRQGWCEVYPQQVTAQQLVDAALDLWGDPQRLATMAAIARRQVDGLGAERIAGYLQRRFVVDRTRGDSAHVG